MSAPWKFGVDDFNYVAESIPTLVDQDDKLVALTLAFDVYAKGDRPPLWRDRLHELVKGNVELEERLDLLLNPPVSEYEREEAKWKERASARTKQEQDNREKSKAFILSTRRACSCSASERANGYLTGAVVFARASS